MKPRDEEKRSRLWRTVMLISSVLIILLIAFFITKIVGSNPLLGEWYSEESGYHLEVEDENELTLQGTFGGVHMEIDLHYAMDKTDKIITLKPSAESYADAAEDAEGNITAGEVQELLADFSASYNYSLENHKLTMTDRESGEQYLFTRIEK